MPGFAGSCIVILLWQRGLAGHSPARACRTSRSLTAAVRTGQKAGGRGWWARAVGGLDDLGDDDLGDAAGVMLAGVAVLAEFDAQLAGHDAVWGSGVFPLAGADGPGEGGDRDDQAAGKDRVEVLARPPG